MSTVSSPKQDGARIGTRYRTYKLSTDRLAGWLATTAKKLRIESYCPTKTLRISQYGMVTDHIVSAVPRVKVPLDVLHTAETALHLRQERANLLRGTDPESDERHQHIITAIEDVVIKLRAHIQESRGASEVFAVVDPAKVGNPIPSFEHLNVDPMEKGRESCSGSEAESTIKPRAKVNKSKQKKLQKEKKRARREAKQSEASSDDEEDPYFVLMCLLSDLKSMRMYVKEVWQEYKEGKLDLITASLTTNATFDIIRTYEIDFPGISFLLGDYSQTMKLILPRHLDDSEKGLELFFRPPTEIGNVKTDDLVAVGQTLSKIHRVAELTFASAYYFLQGPRHVIVQRKSDKEMKTIEEKSDPFGNYQPERGRQKLSPTQRFMEDIQILTAYAKHVYRFDDFRHFQLDHFTMQWREDFAKTGDRTVTLAQAFGAQLYLDVQHVLRQDSVRGLHDLFLAVTRIFKSRKWWREQTPQDIYKAQEQWRQMEHNIESTTNVLAAMVARPIVKAMGKGNGSSGYDENKVLSFLRKSDTVLPFMRMNPLMCGILFFEATHCIRDAGNNISCYFDAVKYAGQIYYGSKMQREYWKQKAASDVNFQGSTFEKALNRSWQRPMVWDDMEFLFELHGVDAFFNGQIPETNYDLVKTMVPSGRLQVGHMYESKRHKGKGIRGPILAMPKLTRNGSGKVDFAKEVHGYEPIAVTHQLYYSKYMKRIDRKKSYINDWSLETLQALLQTHLDKHSKMEGTEHRYKLKGTDGDVSQVTILRTLKEALRNESRALHFDHLLFFAFTFMFLRDLKGAAPHILELFRFPSKNNDDDFVAQGASAIFAAVNAPEPGVDLDPFDGCEDDDIFTNAGHVLIDKIIFSEIEFTPTFKDMQLDAIDSIWGIKPGPKRIGDDDELLAGLDDPMARSVYRFLMSGLVEVKE